MTFADMLTDLSLAMTQCTGPCEEYNRKVQVIRPGDRCQTDGNSSDTLYKHQ
jgi:hypothetical protein